MGGMFLGFLSIMLACSMGVETLYTVFPTIEIPLRVCGAGYILWLAWKVLNTPQRAHKHHQRLGSLKDGLVMQYANPKVIFYGLTVTSSFLAPQITHTIPLIGASVFLAGMAFLATSSWALLGTFFRRYLAKPRIHTVFNAVMAGLLVYCALSILGVV
jgi:threonine/homoserine/homoserine lactone efflux protein